MSKVLSAEETQALRAKALAAHNAQGDGQTAPSRSAAMNERPAAALDAQEQARRNALLAHTAYREAVTVDKVTPQGLVPRLSAWGAAAAETTGRYLRWTKPVGAAAHWAGSLAWRGFKAHALWLVKPKGHDGVRHYKPVATLAKLAAEALFIVASPVIVMGGYYHSTVRNYDIYVPNAGVFVNQQFLKPSQPGHVIAPRDEIFTVLAQDRDDKGRIEPVRFDIDANAYFFYLKHAMRPDLLAASMVPISPYGATCHVKATGIYTRLPRALRVRAVKWMDLRAEIVGLNADCQQLAAVPPAYFAAPPVPPKGVKALPAPPAPHLLAAPTPQPIVK